MIGESRSSRRRFFIRFAWQEKAGDHYKLRKFAVWPILFETAADAWAFLSSLPDPFRNLHGRRKLSLTVRSVKLP
ncbi:hypothetical protein [Ancylobacter rudongensis]|uniref:Uncharacterized protein n=1 Tax=Ancylobacter rudongensis TaxID=177413 RepID=A0A1G4UNZ5_9HYPH|nr:hypothetical protein [Ancylobacter rudongensis]SCW95373.1 hypothetical protein SAMN05660859_0012 [Ancylobacter rudongensis]